MARPVGPPPRNGARAITPRPATSASPPSGSGSASDPLSPRKHVGDFFKCVADASEYAVSRTYSRSQALDRIEKVYQSGWTTVEKASMGEGHGAVGGYIVPLEMSLAMMDVVSEESFVYPRASVFPMSSKSLQLPKPFVETAQVAGTAPYFGGVLFKWGSAQAPQETEPTFGQVTLDAWDLLGYCVLSNQFLADTGPAGEAALVRILGKAAAYYAELAFFQGTGSALEMPLGIVNAPGTIVVTRNAGSQIKTVDIATMASKLLPYAWRRALWAVSPSTWVQTAQLATFYLNEYSGQDGDGRTGSLLSKPVFTSDKLNALGSPGDVCLFDPSLYVVGNRQEVIVDVSTHDAFRNNQTTFKVWLRMDGKCWNAKAITLQDGSSTASPFVILV